MRKIISSIIAVTTILTASLNSFQTIPKANAVSYRNSYKIYGDLNNDKAINSFDVISMRKAIITGDTSSDLDFNRDDKVDSADLKLLNGYVLGENTFFDAYLYDDADEDSVCDILEIAVLQSDPDSKDTDGDTLTDFEEIVYSNTSPTNNNTRGLAVTDADDDPDEDGLTNKEEISAKTNPLYDDSDMDGINDYDELKKYNTDPNNEDSDNDGIIDGDEIKIGLLPDSDKSDGQTPDNQRIIEQIIPADSPLLSDINTDDNAYNLSLIINASGCADSCLSVNPSGFAYVMKDGSALGEVPALQYSNDFTVKDITIKFEIKEAFRDNVSHYFDTIDGNYYDYTYTVPAELDGIKRLNIFKYFEDINLAMPIETLYDTDNNIVYTKISKFETDENGKSYGIGSYSLVDLEVWSDIMNSCDETNTPKPQNAPMSVSLDSNYSILGNEDASIVKTLKELTDSIRDAITKTYESYQVSNNESDNSIHYFSLFGHQYACIEASQIDWAAAEAKCETMGGHLMTVNTPMELSLLNGSLSEGKNGGFYWLGASGGSSNWSWVTGESTSYAKTVKVSGYDMDHCRNYFSYLGNKLAYVPHLGYLSAGTPSTSKIKGFICEWENGANIKKADGTGVAVFIGGNKIILNGKIAASSGTDTDHDGVSDYNEVDVNAIKKIGGSSAQTITWKQGHDYLNNKGYISDKSYEKISDLVKDIAKNQEVYPTKSNPADVDTDGDGLLDCEDEFPMQNFTINLNNCIEKIQNIEKCLKDYLSEIGQDRNDYTDYCMFLIRTQTPKYTGLKWFITAGNTYADDKFVKYLNMKDKTCLEYFQKMDEHPIFDVYGNEIDFLHLIATLSGQYNKSSHFFIDEDLSGWLGDLQSFIYDLKIATYGTNKDLKDTALKLIATGDTKFDSTDMFADIDAKNISCIYDTNNLLSHTIEDYYQKYTSKRFNLFINNSGGIDSIKEKAKKYTSQSLNPSHQLLTSFADEAANETINGKNLTDIFLSNYYIDENGVHYTLEIPNIVTKEESEALVYAFVTYIQNGKEKEDER